MATMRHSRFALVFSILILLAFAGLVRGDIIYVDDSAKSGGNGTTWKKAFRSLSDALAQAEAGDEIRIGKGKYRPAGSNGKRTATFKLKEGVLIQGGYAGVNSSNPNKLKPSKYKVYLSGDLKGNDGSLNDIGKLKDNVYHVITAKNITAATEVRGVTIERGYASSTSITSNRSKGAGVYITGSEGPTFVHCSIRKNRATWGGAGLAAIDGIATLHNCTVRDNMVPSTAVGGAGVWAKSAVIEDCTFRRNDAGIASSSGGAIRADVADITTSTFDENESSAVMCGGGSAIRSCLFTQNTGEDGGAITIFDGQVGIIDCEFESNIASSFGGAVYNMPGGSASVINSVFISNGATDGNAIANRGIMLAANCVLVGNQAPFLIGGRGALYNAHSGVLNLVNCTIANNTFEDGPGAGLYNDGGVSTVINTIMWGNVGSEPGEDSQLFVDAGEIIVDNSCIQGWSGALGGQNNSGDNPDFQDLNGDDNDAGTRDDDLRLSASSNCKDKADSAALPADAFDVDNDGDTAEPLPLDADANQRITGSAMDLGAYES